MKKILFATFFSAAIALSFSSCINGDYDANPATTNSNGNPLNTGGSGSGSGGGGSSSFNWSGTDPMSAKIDGAAWQATGATYLAGQAGFPAFVSGDGPGNSNILVYIPDNATIGATTAFGSRYTASYSADTKNGNSNSVYGAALGSGGAVQILEEDATHIKGKFYFGGKNLAGGSVNITEGYFNVTK